ncbi:MAG: hypothetical protein WBI91_01890 [Coriobacteriia bacterium]
MVTESERQAIVDDEHLRMLPVFYWVLGAMDILFSLYGLLYVAYGVFFLMVPFDSTAASAQEFPAFIGWFMFAMGAAFIIGFGVLATLKILAGFWIKRRTRRTACLVIAGISCLTIPFGTIVGVFTFIVLSRPSVAALFVSGQKRGEPSLVDAPAAAGDES